MERFIADLVRNFESGRINRRQFCEAVTLAATVYAAGDAAKAQPARGLKMLGINHISYSCADYTKVRDFYVKHLGMESTAGKDNGSRANLMFGPEQGKGGQFVVARNARATANPRPAASGVVDHVCYTISNWDEARVTAGLKETGRSYVQRPGNVNVLDPFNYPLQLANSEEENPWK
jgi:catechol 2,3-dioxygenase-like lactoylglutathione lyase family enzyme